MADQYDPAALAEALGTALGIKRTPVSLGDVNGNLYDPDNVGYVFVTQDSDGGITQTFSVRQRGVQQMNPGMGVELALDRNGQLAVVGFDFEGAIASGLNPIAHNPADRYANGAINQERIQTLQCHAFGTTASPSMFVVVRAWLARRGTTWTYLSEQQVDLTSSVPSSGNHLLAAVWITAANVVSVTTSTAQPTTTPFDITDIQECQNGISGQATPVRLWRLYGGQTAVVETDSYVDGRQFLSTSSTLTVQELDAVPSVAGVLKIILPNGSETDDGNGQITLSAGLGGSVGLSTDASWLTVGGSPTINGTITLNKTTGLTANQALLTPDGVTGVVGPRSLVNNDLPVVSMAKGGTGISSYTAGDLLVANDAGTLVKLPGGTNSDVLTYDSTGNPNVKWAAPAASVVAFTAAPSSVFDVSGSGSASIALSMDNQAANTALMGAVSGGSGAPAFRAFVDTDGSTLWLSLAPATAARNTIQPSADIVPFTVKGKASQTANLQEWQDSSANLLSKVDASGFHGIGAGSSALTSQMTLVAEDTSATRGLAIYENAASAAAAVHHYYKSRGTYASPATINDTDYIGAVSFEPHDGTAYRLVAGFGARVNGTVASNSIPTDLFFYTTGGANDSNPYLNGHVRMVIAAAGNMGIGTLFGTQSPATLLHALLNNATTNAVDAVLTLGHNSTGTVANGFGVGINLTLEDSTTADVTAAQIQALWNDKTHASYKGDLVVIVNDSGGAREVLRGRGTGTAAAIGFLGAAPVVAQTQGATLTNNITSGGSANTLANYTSLSVYATDAAAIRNNLYQIGQTLKTVVDALRLFGLLT